MKPFGRIYSTQPERCECMCVYSIIIDIDGFGAIARQIVNTMHSIPCHFIHLDAHLGACVCVRMRVACSKIYPSIDQ